MVFSAVEGLNMDRSGLLRDIEGLSVDRSGLLRVIEGLSVDQSGLLRAIEGLSRTNLVNLRRPVPISMRQTAAHQP